MLRGAVERLCAAATAIALVPVWLTPWFPTQDGPSHLYNALLLAHYEGVVQVAFVPHVALFPNWTSFLLLESLARLVPPLVAQKLLLSLCVLAIPLATLYLQKSFKREADAGALLGVMLAYSYLFFMGFFNFILGCAVFAWIAGCWWRNRQSPRWLMIYALLALAYFTHGLPFAAAVLALTLLMAFERRWRDLLPLIPAYAIAAADSWSRLHAVRAYRPLTWKLARLAALEPFAFFNDTHTYLAWAASALIVIAIALSLRGMSREQRAAMLLTGALLILFFVSPRSYVTAGSKGAWIIDRFLMLAVMTLPAWVTVRGRTATAVMLVLTALHLGLTWRDLPPISRDVGDVAQCRSAIPDHTTLDTAGEPPDMAMHFQPLRHAPAYLAADRDVAYLADYEAELDDFPIRFRPGVRLPARYVLVWNGTNIEGEVVCRGKTFRLVRR